MLHYTNSHRRETTMKNQNYDLEVISYELQTDTFQVKYGIVEHELDAGVLADLVREYDEPESFVGKIFQVGIVDFK